MRYFFDYTAQDQSLLDHHGDEFISSESAIDFAEAIVEHLTQSLASDWSGWSVEVRNAFGDKLISLPVSDRRAVCNLRPEMRPVPSRNRALLIQ
jgi:hypothetical protein